MTTDEETVELTHAQLTALLKAAVDEREQRDYHGRFYDKYAAMFRSYLRSHPEERLWDGLNEIEARLQRRGTGDNFDVASMPWALIEQLRDARLLTINAAGVRALTDQRLKADVVSYKSPGGETFALIVERKP